MGQAHPGFTEWQRNSTDPVYGNPPYTRISDYYRQRWDSGGNYREYPRYGSQCRNSWYGSAERAPIPLLLEVPDEEIGHGWRWLRADGALEIQPADPAWRDSDDVFQYAYVYHLAVEGSPSALRGHCTCHLKERALQHFRYPRRPSGGGVNPHLFEHVRNFLADYGRPPRVTMHVLWKGSAERYTTWQLRALEQAYVEAAIKCGMPLFNVQCPLGVKHRDFLTEIQREALLQLAQDPSEIVRNWIWTVLDQGWSATAVGTGILDPFCGSGERIDYDPESIHVQRF